MTKYKNIVFDIGHVLLDYRWAECLEDYGYSNEYSEALVKRIHSCPDWAQFDYENFKYEDVVEMYVDRFPEDEEALRCFFSDPYKMWLPRKEVWERVHELKKKGYKIFLLSNYSSVLFESHTKDTDFIKEIDGRIISYEVHNVKPHRGIFSALFNKYGLDPAECIFFDDLADNVEASKRYGMDAVVIDSKETILSQLDGLLAA